MAFSLVFHFLLRMFEKERGTQEHQAVQTN